MHACTSPRPLFFTLTLSQTNTNTHTLSQLTQAFERPAVALAWSPGGDFLATAHAGELGISLWASREHFGGKGAVVGTIVSEGVVAARGPRRARVPPPSSEDVEGEEGGGPTSSSSSPASAAAAAKTLTVSGTDLPSSTLTTNVSGGKKTNCAQHTQRKKE